MASTAPATSIEPKTTPSVANGAVDIVMAPAATSTSTPGDAPAQEGKIPEGKRHSQAIIPRQSTQPKVATIAPAPSKTPDVSGTKRQTSSSVAPEAPPPSAQHQDGRIRNPVPSKLKGKTDGRNGNFSVMQIDLTRPEVTERDLAAKRTSEGTQAAARLANRNGYRPVKRSRLIWLPPKYEAPPPSQQQPQEQSSQSQSQSQSQSRPAVYPAAPPPAIPYGHAPQPPNSHGAHPPPPASAQAAHPAPPPPPPSAAAQQSQRGPSAIDTKQEQARLLTLLRSLHPVLVVDQICKALAYFGGIPGAPPPADGVFPPSASTNGSGALFVGWIAEIFPHLDRQPENGQPPQTLPPIPAIGAVGQSTTANGLSVPVKRTRGRPKGSKSSKARKDKGVKKTGVATTAETSPDAEHATQSTTVDSSGQPNSGEPVQPDAVTDTEQSQNAPSSVAQAPLGEQDPNSSMLSTPGSKKRGRPKGSKNRPKAIPYPQAGTVIPANNPPTTHPPATQMQTQSAEPPLIHKTTSTQIRPSAPQTGSSTTVVQPTLPSDVTRGSTIGQENVPQDALGVSVKVNSIMPQGGQNPQDQSGAQTPTTLPRKKRPPSRLSHGSMQASTNTSAEKPDTVLQADDVAPKPGPTQVPQAKRRRISKETGPKPGFSAMDSQSSGTEMSGSPNLSSTMTPTGQSSTTMTTFPSPVQQNMMATFTSGLNQRPQQQQTQQKRPLQPNNGFNQYQPQQNRQTQRSPHLGSQRPGQAMPSPAPPGQRTQMPSAPNRQQPTFSPQQQAYYQQQQQRQAQQQQQQQRQLANQYAQSANANTTYNRNMGATSPAQFQQNLNSQTPAFNTQQPQQPQHNPAQSMNSFQVYSNQNYLDMDYSMNNQSNSAGAFGSHTQLEAALAEPNMRESIYHAIGRR